VDDLVRWLSEQLDEDERIARAVRVPHDWHQGPGDDPEWTDAEMVCMWPPEFHTPYERDKHWRGLGVEGAELAAHIAAHDPARVLREIDAKRRLVECHEPWTASNGDTICGRCGREHIDGRPGGHFPCQTLRLLALPYADRPGYREEWRP
jgi:hypothetical protein